MTKQELVESITTFLAMTFMQAQAQLEGEIKLTIDGKELIGEEAMTFMLETNRPVAEALAEYLMNSGLELRSN